MIQEKQNALKKKKRNIHNNLALTSTLSLRSYISLQINWNNKYGLKETNQIIISYSEHESRFFEHIHWQHI